MASASQAALIALSQRVDNLEKSIKILDTRYGIGNWSSNYDLTSRRDLSFAVGNIGYALQPIVTVGNIANNRNTTTTILNTVGGPSGGALLSIALFYNAALVPGDNNQGQLLLTTDGQLQTINSIDANNAQFRGDITNMFTRVTLPGAGQTQGLLVLPLAGFLNSLLVQWTWAAGGTSVSNANNVQVQLLWSATTS